MVPQALCTRSSSLFPIFPSCEAGVQRPGRYAKGDPLPCIEAKKEVFAFSHLNHRCQCFSFVEGNVCFLILSVFAYDFLPTLVFTQLVGTDI
jgi:hypothetical protein